MLAAKAPVVHIRSAGRRDPALHTDQAAHIVQTAAAEHTVPVVVEACIVQASVAEHIAPVAVEAHAAPAAAVSYTVAAKLAVQHTAALAMAEVQALAVAVPLIAVESEQSIWAEAVLSLEQPGPFWEPARR